MSRLRMEGDDVNMGTGKSLPPRITEHVLKDGSITYWVRYEYYDTGGKRHTKTKKGFRALKDAKDFQAETSYKIKRGMFVAPSSYTLGGWLQTWLSEYCGHVRDTTLEGYTNLSKHVTKFGEPLAKLQNVRGDTIQRLFNCMRNEIKQDGSRRYKETTLYNLYRVLNIAFEQAMALAIINRNPLEAVRPPKKEKYEHVIITVPQAEGLLSYVDRYDDIVLPVLFASVMGMRRGEALGLRWQDVDLTEKKLRVLKSRTIANGKIVCGDVKTEKSRRVLVMPDFLVKILSEYKKNMTLSIRNPERFVCVNIMGIPHNPNSVSKRFKRALVSVGLPPMRFHDLRHTSAAIMVAAGASPKEVSDYLGHSSISITMDLYADIFDETKKLTAQKIDSLFTEK